MASAGGPHYPCFSGAEADQQQTQTALLQMHVQIEAVRDTLLQQAAQHHEIVMAKLATLEATLQSIASGAVPVRVEGLLRFQDLSQCIPQPPQIQPALQPGVRRPRESALQPSPPPSRSNQLSNIPHEIEDDNVPRYNLYNARTVDEIWREYKFGIDGGPSVEQLERDYQARWRPTGQLRTAWCRRKVIVDEMIRLIDSGRTAKEAIAELEAQRGSLSITKFRDHLVAQQKMRDQRPATGGRGRPPARLAEPVA